jgi:hypothetical protein
MVQCWYMKLHFTMKKLIRTTQAMTTATRTGWLRPQLQNDNGDGEFRPSHDNTSGCEQRQQYGVQRPSALAGKTTNDGGEFRPSQGNDGDGGLVSFCPHEATTVQGLALAGKTTAVQRRFVSNSGALSVTRQRWGEKRGGNVQTAGSWLFPTSR